MNKKRWMLCLYIVLDIILVGAFIYSINEFGLSTQRDQLFAGVMGLVAVSGIISTIRCWKK